AYFMSVLLVQLAVRRVDERELFQGTGSQLGVRDRRPWPGPPLPLNSAAGALRAHGQPDQGAVARALKGAAPEAALALAGVRLGGANKQLPSIQSLDRVLVPGRGGAQELKRARLLAARCIATMSLGTADRHGSCLPREQGPKHARRGALRVARPASPWPAR